MDTISYAVCNRDETRDPDTLHTRATVHGERLAFQWNVTNVQTIINGIDRDFPHPVTVDLFADDLTTNYQEIWDIRNPPPPPACDKRLERPTNDDDDDLMIVPLGLPENYGFYVAAHHSIESYGILISANGLYTLSERIAALSGVRGGIYRWGEGTTCCKDIAYEKVVALELLFWHLATHAWIEDLCSIAQNVMGIDFYSMTRNQNGNFIAMEEGIANSSALGMLKAFMHSHKQKEAVFTAVRQVFDASPVGYRDYADLPGWTTHDELLQKNILLLLTRVYGIPQSLALHAMRIYLDPTSLLFSEDVAEIHRFRRPKVENDDFASNLIMRRYAWPVTIIE